MAFLLTLTEKSRGLGGKTTPPPVNCAARIVPARARPVPFWRHGFARPPETMPRLFAARVPCRRGVQLGPHRLVDEMRLDLGGEDGLVERDLLLRATEHGCLRRGH